MGNKRNCLSFLSIPMVICIKCTHKNGYICIYTFQKCHSDSRNHKKTHIFKYSFIFIMSILISSQQTNFCVPLFLISGSYCLSGCRSLRPAEYSFLYLSYLNFVTQVSLRYYFQKMIFSEKNLFKSLINFLFLLFSKSIS